ncbi:hypothetical protein L1987_67352 [Smallanthus sonchifolius]|uniref:Uncharacterized protein n=1 Tax=Smallanthus sonchifolius TaxID=185202 RepID=A0ACB9B2Z4_9ASTR|nr:hypothetical protein L1987_67352 [Smallanthus sonchifolius]
MGERLDDHVLEKILIGLDAKDLIRCKSVCKSWYSFITSLRFNKDRYNNELGHRRITSVTHSGFHCRFCHDDNHHHHLVGSSNGLVCISSFRSELLVGNPFTREVRHLKLPPSTGLTLCWGFGYDSSTDDYKVIVGAWQGKNQTCVQVLSLKSNIWRVVGEVKYSTFIIKVGVLCNGGLHWIIKDQNNKNLIICYDLSKEEFKEIPQPNDERYEGTSCSNLGIMKECLCIFRRSQYSFVDVWMMKNYNVKKSWELLQHDREKKYDIVHFLVSPTNESFFHDDASWCSHVLEHQELNWANQGTEFDAAEAVKMAKSPLILNDILFCFLMTTVDMPITRLSNYTAYNLRINRIQLP